MATPIIMTHIGSDFYQKFSLHQAHNSNPESDIFLITDNKTHNYPFVKNINIQKYSNTADVFSKLYIHQSSNSYEYELMCFRRWFIIYEFALEYNLKDFICLDSDILIFCKISDIAHLIKAEEFTVTNKIGPQVCYFPTVNKLSFFCDFIVKMYSSDFYKTKMNAKYAIHLAENKPGGVCDMTAFDYYQSYELKNILDLAEVRKENRFDDNINESEGYEIEISKSIKKITLINNQPYCKNLATNTLIKFSTLHFQGRAKDFIPSFYSYNDLEKDKLYFRIIKLSHKLRMYYGTIKNLIKKKLKN